jgi:exodeoxyribonuclease-3
LVRIATWNVNGLRARLDFVLHWLRTRQPDIVGIQEAKASEEEFPYDALSEAGYHAFTHLQKAWNGVAILTRKPVDEIVQKGLPGQDELGARLITADLDGLRFTTIYVPNGKSVEHDDYSLKLDWLDMLAQHVRHDGPGRPRILCGDFNVAPAPIDSWNENALAGTIFHTEPERDRVQALYAAGLADLFRHKYPTEQKFSWWDYRGGAFHKRQGLRIDFLLGSADLLPRIREVEIDRDYRKKQDGLTPSDHAPVIVDLD